MSPLSCTPDRRMPSVAHRAATSPAFMSQLPRPNSRPAGDARFERIGGPLPQVAGRDDVDVTVEHQRRRIAGAGSPSGEPADEPPGLVPIDLDAGEVGPGSDLVERDLPVVDVESVVGEDAGRRPRSPRSRRRCR